mmetsp:Transcript_48256/g.67031  ORF Transcript_48256/g.67031 Transcript_48256/m.67031 type:complete len:99 (+) Transcript_48256:395-691(+)
MMSLDSFESTEVFLVSFPNVAMSLIIYCSKNIAIRRDCNRANPHIKFRDQVLSTLIRSQVPSPNLPILITRYQLNLIGIQCDTGDWTSLIETEFVVRG